MGFGKSIYVKAYIDRSGYCGLTNSVIVVSFTLVQSILVPGVVSDVIGIGSVPSFGCSVRNPRGQ
jgi:hypothetical protein